MPEQLLGVLLSFGAVRPLAAAALASASARRLARQSPARSRVSSLFAALPTAVAEVWAGIQVSAASASSKGVPSSVLKAMAHSLASGRLAAVAAALPKARVVRTL